jgi:predicted RNA-binding Zn-ribbon protein involved in translation (DUF1610 family)
MAGRDFQRKERSDEGRRNDIDRSSFQFVCRKCGKDNLGWSRGCKAGKRLMCMDCLVRDLRTGL